MCSDQTKITETKCYISGIAGSIPQKALWCWQKPKTLYIYILQLYSYCINKLKKNPY